MSITTNIYAATNLRAVCAYPFTDKPDQKERGERVILDGAHGPCTVLTAADDFAATQRTFHKRGYKTHVRDESGKRTGEVADVRAMHVIMSSDTLDPDNPDDVAKLDELVATWLKENAEGNQAVYALQADGDGGKLHAHIVVNTVAWQSCWVDGKQRRAGRLFTGEATDITKIRRDVDQLCARLDIEQKLPEYDIDRQPVKVSKADYYGRKRGKPSDRDKIRQAVDASILQLKPGQNHEHLVSLLQEHDVEMTYGTHTRGKHKGEQWVKFRLGDAERRISGSTLGSNYESVGLVTRIYDHLKQQEQQQPAPKPPQPVTPAVSLPERDQEQTPQPIPEPVPVAIPQPIPEPVPVAIPQPVTPAVAPVVVEPETPKVDGWAAAMAEREQRAANNPFAMKPTPSEIKAQEEQKKDWRPWKR